MKRTGDKTDKSRLLQQTTSSRADEKDLRADHELVSGSGGGGGSFSHISTFFFQGNGASRSQGAQYAGKQGIRVISEKGEILPAAICSRAPLLLHNIHTYLELREVEYSCWNPFLWPCHLITQCNLWRKGIGGLGARSHGLRFWRMNVGGAADVRQHTEHFAAMLETTPVSTSVVLFGCSRGAATTMISVSQMPEELRKRISLVLLEAPFDTVPSVLEKSVCCSPCAAVQLLALEHLGEYETKQFTPVDAANCFPLDIPVAFITSMVDDRVPITCTQPLIDTLRSRGHPHLHHCMLSRSGHSNMSYGNPDDQHKYELFVADLYGKYCTQK